MININWSTLILQIGNFVVMAVILTRFFFKPVIKALDERSTRVTGALEEAERQQREAAEMRTKYEQALAEAQEQVVALQQQAQVELQETKQRVLGEAREEIRVMREKAQQELEEARQQAIQQHRRELGYLATTLSGRLIQQAGGNTFQKATIDEFVDRLSTLPADEYSYALGDLEAEVVQIQLVSANELDAASTTRITEQATAMLQKPVELRLRVDPALVAGATLRFGDIVIDGSLAGQLQALTERYLAEAVPL